jgi:flavin-dependent dehydrogenase
VNAPAHFDDEAEIVVIGAGTTGIIAALAARQAGASVIVVEAEAHIGGHAICSGGNLSFGGGNSCQKKYGTRASVPRSDRLDRGRAERRAAVPL